MSAELPSGAPGGPLVLRWLHVLTAVVAHGSVARAAAELCLSASAVSRAVRQTEAAIGIDLFERGARGMTALPVARQLALRAQRAHEQLLKADAAGRARAPTPRRALRVSQITDGMLHALVSTARSGNETAAAATLGVTQPAVHLRLRALAHLAGTPLVRRTDRGVRLTDAGERWAAAAELALGELRVAEEELAGWRGQSVGQLAVGALPMAGTELVPRALGRLLERLPGVQATVADGTYETLLHLLRHGEIDLVVGPLRGVLAAADIEEQTLFVDHLVPVVRAGHPWLGRSKAVLRRGLSGADWISPLRGSPARAAFEAAFRAAGHEPPAARLHANSPSAVRALLLQSDRVALLSPLQVLSDVAGGVLAVLPLPLADTERVIGVTTRRAGLPSPACRVFMDELRAVVVELQLTSATSV